MANEIEPIQPQESKVSHAVEMRNRALSMRLRTVKSYGVGNSEISQILGLGLLPRQNIIIEEAQRVVAEFSASPPSGRGLDALGQAGYGAGGASTSSRVIFDDGVASALKSPKAYCSPSR